MVDYTSIPALFRAGDIGVSSEWRDITYDWSPLLTADGVFIYSYLRDSFDNQRILRPFILDPDGPTKQRIQRVLGRKSAYAVQGPEYLLETVGLLHVEVQRGPSADPDRLKYTTTTYYVVGRLDHPVLDWPIMERVLNALMIALDEPSSEPGFVERQRKAQAALRSLGQAGMLQNEHPEHLFEPDGVWPALLPTLVEDKRWVACFAHLHGLKAIDRFRRHARTWVEWTQRRSERAEQENMAIREQVVGAQRRSRSTTWMRETRTAIHTRMSTLGGTDGPEVTSGPSVPPMSLARPRGIEVTSGLSGTSEEITHGDALAAHQCDVPHLSLDRQLINSSSSGEETSIQSFSGTTDHPVNQADPALHSTPCPRVAPHLREDELVSGCVDARFWRTVQQILHATEGRYAHTEGEKKAIRRLLNKTGAPAGVVLAALRAVATLSSPERPQTLADALQLPTFHTCLQHAIALLPAQAAPAQASTWQDWLALYRSVGRPHRLRNVDVEDYHVLRALFERQPDACWDVLSRARHAAVQPELSPAYLRRALLNNQKEGAVLSQPYASPSAYETEASDVVTPFPVSAATHDASTSDPRLSLLRAESVSIDILTDGMTEAYIRAWIAEADARETDVYRRSSWLRWGLMSGHLPHEHPALRTRCKPSSANVRHAIEAVSNVEPTILDSELHTSWQATLTALREQVPRSDFDTWIKPCVFIALEPSTDPAQARRAVVGTPNIFVRQEIETTFYARISQTLSSVLDTPVELEIVIGS
jgi:hypothetical protein